MSPTLDPHRRRSTSTAHVRTRNARGGLSAVRSRGGDVDVIDTSGRGRGYSVLTGGTERSARKRRTQQDALFAEALGATGAQLFPVYDQTGANVSEDHTYLRPDQVGQLVALQGGPASEGASGAAGIRARPSYTTASNPFAMVGNAILDRIPGFGAALQQGQSGRAGIGGVFRHGSVALSEPGSAAAAAAPFPLTGGADGGEGPGALAAAPVSIGGRSVPTWAIVAAVAALLVLR